VGGAQGEHGEGGDRGEHGEGGDPGEHVKGGGRHRVWQSPMVVGASPLPRRWLPPRADRVVAQR
jgi:hypothetical protein